jgi:hypothetical protein
MSLQTRHSARVLAPAVIAAALLGDACGGHGSKTAATTTAQPAARATGVTTAPTTPVADGDGCAGCLSR